MLSEAAQMDAARVAMRRQNAAETRGFKPHGHGSFQSHLLGRMAEQAVADYLQVPLDPDWTWEADRARGADIIAGGTKYHVRSSRKGDRFIWRPGKDSRQGRWIFCCTADVPFIEITGWLPGYLAPMFCEDGYIDSCHLRELPPESKDPWELRIAVAA